MTIVTHGLHSFWGLGGLDVFGHQQRREQPARRGLLGRCVDSSVEKILYLTVVERLLLLQINNARILSILSNATGEHGFFKSLFIEHSQTNLALLTIVCEHE